MSINLGDAEKQKERISGPIPKGSKVKVRLIIQQPKDNTQDPNDPAVRIFESGLKGLDCELEVVSGTFEGIKIWEYLFLPPQFQTISMTKGQKGACEGSFAMCRAIIESTRNINPDDPSADRNISSWFDLHDLEFPVKIGIQKPKAGDIYINNKISKVLTLEDEDYQVIMDGGEIITDTPIPEIPAGAKKEEPAQKSWTQNSSQQEEKKEEKPAQTNIPDWAKGK